MKTEKGDALPEAGMYRCLLNHHGDGLVTVVIPFDQVELWARRLAKSLGYDNIINVVNSDIGGIGIAVRE